MESLKILAVIPTYNCESHINRTLQNLIDANLEISTVWIIDNKSDDATVRNAQTFLFEHPNNYEIEIRQNPRNLGLGGTHKKAFHWALEGGFSHIAIIHGDFQSRAHNLKEMLELTQVKPEGFILGSRFMKKSTRVGYSNLRTFMNYIFNILISIRTKCNIKDLGSGLNVFPLEEIKKIDYLECADDLTFNIDLLLRIVRNKQKIVWHPIEWHEDNQISNVRILSQTIATLKKIALS